MGVLIHEIKVVRWPAKSKYKAVHRRTGQELSGWTGSPDQALTTGEATLREQRQKKKVRRCLRCGREFVSHHFGHRLCSPRCREDAGLPDYGVTGAHGSGGGRDD